MNPEEYAAAQALIAAQVAGYVKRVAGLFTGPTLSLKDWLGFLQIIFPEVQRRYQQSAELGRSFYDFQRRKAHPQLDRNDRLLSELQFDWFVQNMEPARRGLSQADAPNVAVVRVSFAAVREVEMAGRRQIIGAVKNDPEKRIVQGWARVATGAETCAWCLMLISRGAEFPGKDTKWYFEAASGGINLDDTTVLDLFNESAGDLQKFREFTKDHIEEWHVGCDCLVVPVFDIKSWPGREQAQQAQQLWIEASKEAEALIRSGKARTSNKGTETLNALRRRLDRGEIIMSDYAVAA